MFVHMKKQQTAYESGHSGVKAKLVYTTIVVICTK